MSTEQSSSRNLTELKYELNYQQQLLYFRKKAGASGKELTVIGLRITRLGLMIVLASRNMPGASWKQGGSSFSASQLS